MSKNNSKTTSAKKWTILADFIFTSCYYWRNLY